MKAFAVVIRRVQTDVRGRRWFAQILHVNVTHASPFGTNTSIEHVIGVTRVAGFVGWNAMILEVSRRNVMHVVHIEALSERLHDVAGKAERRGLRALHVRRESDGAAQDWKKKKRDEGEDFSLTRRGEGGTRQQQDN